MTQTLRQRPGNARKSAQKSGIAVEPPVIEETEEAETVRGPRVSNASLTYETLRHEILSMVLRPGEILDEVSVSKRFGTSRSPIREAIVRLSGEGLVTVLPNRSTIVSNLDIAMLPAFLDALELTQRAVTRLAAIHRTAADLEKIRVYQAQFAEYQAALNLSEMLAANYEYHMSIAEAGRNKYFAMLYGRLLDEGKRLMHMNYSFEIMPAGESRATLADEHSEITAAIEARDADLAERLGYEHALLFRKRVLRHVMSSELTNVTVKSSG